MARVFGTPKWDEKRKEWRLGIRNAGKRTTVTSKQPSQRKGHAECYQKAAAWVGDKNRPETIRFGKAWEEYLQYYDKKYKITSLKQTEGRGKAHLLPTLRLKLLSSICKRDWQGIIDNAFEGGAKSIKTLKGIATTIISFCKWCAAKGYLRDTDVPQYFEYPIAAGQKPKHILQPDQLRLLFSPAADDGNFYLHCFRFLAVTGLRRGELCALQFERDFDGQTITVRESISHDQDITDGKTENANRSIRLTPIALEQIGRHRAKNRGEVYLFCDPHGRRISPRVLRNHWQKWREAHGVELTLHELRHTFISYSRLKSSLDLEQLKELYGHSADMDTDKVYVHAIIKTPEEILEENRRQNELTEKLNLVFEAVLDTQRDTQKT